MRVEVLSFHKEIVCSISNWRMLQNGFAFSDQRLVVSGNQGSDC